MATQLLATGSTAADSTELTVSAGTPVTVSLKGIVYNAQVNNTYVSVQIKDDAGVWQAVGSLSCAQPAISITAAGVYKFTRAAGVTCGVFSA